MVAFLVKNAPFLLAGVLLTFLSSFGQTFFISVFAGEIRTAFGLSHGHWGALYSAGTLTSALAMIWAGTLTDRVRVRVIGPAVIVLLSVAAASMALAESQIALVFAVFLLRFAGQGMASHIALVAMARWYVTMRGRALSIAHLGVAAGEAFLPLAMVALLAGLDWRMIWFGVAAAILILIPALFFLLRLERTPQAIAKETVAVGFGGRHWTRGELLRNSLFWFLLPALLAPSAFSTAFFFHQVHIGEVMGWGHATLVALFPVFTAAAIFGLFLSGWMVDRLGARVLMPGILLPMALGFLILGFVEDVALVAFAMASMGLAQGANSTVPAAFWAEAYGTRHLGAIKSLTTAIMVFGTAIGPVLTGAFIDLGTPFPAQTPWIAAYFLAAAALVRSGIRRAEARAL
ncbi:MAG: MFS transporter [Pseudomonadota bacterium]